MGTSLSWHTDTQLHDAVRRELDEDPGIAAHQIAVVAADGVITLTGFVGSYGAKVAAEQIVRRVRGVRGIANDIEVAIREQRIDPQIAAEAVHALQSQTDVSDRVQVMVSKGDLTLEGSVEWMYQKAAAESAVKYLKGVRSLSNSIQVSQTPTVIDVKARLEAALRRSATVDAARIGIATDNRTITLSGDVHSWSEREEAERVAWTCPGVARVVNLLRVVI